MLIPKFMNGVEKSTDNDKPFIIWGESGAGASSIIAASSNSVIH